MIVGGTIPERVNVVNCFSTEFFGFCEFGFVFFHGSARTDVTSAVIADTMINVLAGGQGDAETRPERRARNQDRRWDADRRPVFSAVSNFVFEVATLARAWGLSLFQCFPTLWRAWLRS